MPVSAPGSFTVQSSSPFNQWMKPGPGSVALQERPSISNAPPQGFATVDLSYDDMVTIPVTWTSAS